MTWLLDTNAVSELVARRQNPGFSRWLSATPAGSLYLSAVTIGELQYGILKLDPAAPRRATLLTWLNTIILPGFSGRILSLDLDVARTWALMTSRITKGSVSTADSQIAATAFHHGHAVVSQNVRDMSKFAGLTVENPWT